MALPLLDRAEDDAQRQLRSKLDAVAANPSACTLPGFAPSVGRLKRFRASAVVFRDALVGGMRSDHDEAPYEADDVYGISPLPNWCFQRDPIIALPDGIVVNSMATAARAREAMVSAGTPSVSVK